jgi:hypothetical protein
MMMSLVAAVSIALVVGGIIGAFIMRLRFVNNADSIECIRFGDNYYKVYRLDPCHGGVASDPGGYLEVDE